MKIGLLLCAVAFLALSAPAISATKASHAQPSPIKVAPADEYFGHQKLSILGINNTIHDTNLHIGFDPEHAAKYFGQLAPAQDALLDWAHKYPQDTWLPGRAYFMSHVFWQMHTPAGDAAADSCRALLFKQFARSRWATLARVETKERIAPIVTAASTATAATSTAAAASNTTASTASGAAGGTSGAKTNAAAVPAPAAAEKQKH